MLVSVGDESLPAANQKQWYVSLSRGRERATVYVDSKADVRNAVTKGEQRLSAVELTHTRLRESWKLRLHKSLERNRVSRFVKQRAAAIADYWRGKEGVNYG